MFMRHFSVAIFAVFICGCSNASPSIMTCAVTDALLIEYRGRSLLPDRWHEAPEWVTIEISRCSSTHPFCEQYDDFESRYNARVEAGGVGADFYASPSRFDFVSSMFSQNSTLELEQDSFRFSTNVQSASQRDFRLIVIGNCLVDDDRF